MAGSESAVDGPGDMNLAPTNARAREPGRPRFGEERLRLRARARAMRERRTVGACAGKQRRSGMRLLGRRGGREPMGPRGVSGGGGWRGKEGWGSRPEAPLDS